MPLDSPFPNLFKALFEGESQVIAESQSPCVFLFERPREVKMILLTNEFQKFLVVIVNTHFASVKSFMHVHVFVYCKR